MNTRLFLPLALALPMFASCGEAVDAANKVGGDAANAAGDLAGKAKDMAGDMVGNLKDLDLSSLSPDALKDMAGKATSSITEKLGSIKDLASAKSFKDSVGPIVEKLAAMKDKMGVALPGGDALKSALSNLKADGKILELIKPVIDKLKGLVG